ncbi:MAG: DUF5777 family beta-barrel protein [Bacteroidota bacterium]|nr:DUF5777 family beta-barrel protein [Bacteroidota bacterium]
MKILKTFFLVALFCQSLNLLAQDDLDALLDEITEERVEYVTGAFKSTRVINLQSVEKIGANTLDFRISHRFGALDGGAYELFGLDQATIRFGLEYGVNDWLMVGIGRSTYEKTYDGFVKALLLRQSKGKRYMPISLAYFSAATINSLRWQNPERENYFSSRMAYVHQLIIASKISKELSLQLSPTVVHKNLVRTKEDLNTNYALGFSGRMKVTNRTSINAEYIYRIPPPVKTESFTAFYNSLSVGVDIETGGHVFSLHVSNSLPMIEKGFIMETNKSWLKNGIHFGFNISREFAFKK